MAAPASEERVSLATSGPSPAEAGGILTVDLAALVANWSDLARRAAPAECAAVVKADAYGLGLAPVARALLGAGCRTFFVAHLAEGRALRTQAPDAIIYILNGLIPDTAAAFAEAQLRPVLSSVEQIAEWNAFRAASGWAGGAAVQVDTGMSRLGLRLDEAMAEDVRRQVEEARPSLLLSHFAISEERTHSLNAKQMERFRALRGLYPALPGSLANSSGIFLGPDARHDLVRPGVALYGANPTPGEANPMRPVAGLEARVLQVRSVDEGETVGYGAAWTARRPSSVAILCAGYADGFPRAGGASKDRPGAEVVAAGRRCPIVGRVSMDLLAVDVTDLPPGSVRRGDLVSLLGDEIGVDELAARTGRIPYEILTGLGRRYRRVYIGGS